MVAGTEVLADYGGGALLDRVDGRCGEGVNVVGYAEGADNERAVGLAHTVNAYLSEGENELAEEDGERHSHNPLADGGVKLKFAEANGKDVVTAEHHEQENGKHHRLAYHGGYRNPHDVLLFHAPDKENRKRKLDYHSQNIQPEHRFRISLCLLHGDENAVVEHKCERHYLHGKIARADGDKLVRHAGYTHDWNGERQAYQKKQCDDDGGERDYLIGVITCILHIACAKKPGYDYPASGRNACAER